MTCMCITEDRKGLITGSDDRKINLFPVYFFVERSNVFVYFISGFEVASYRLLYMYRSGFTHRVFMNFVRLCYSSKISHYFLEEVSRDQ